VASRPSRCLLHVIARTRVSSGPNSLSIEIIKQQRILEYTSHRLLVRWPNIGLIQLYGRPSTTSCWQDPLCWTECRIIRLWDCLCNVQVMQVACDVKKSKPVFIVIDGLDETSRRGLEDTATIFSGLFKELHRPNAKVFNSSQRNHGSIQFFR
jgi:hypothetical protein